MVLDTQFLKPGFQLGPQVGKADRRADDVEGYQFILIWHLVLIPNQQLEQGTAVLPARNRHSYPVAVAQQVKFLASPGDGLEEKVGYAVKVAHRFCCQRLANVPVAGERC
jgi:hypothetical protein